jgi:hypothetical protein
MASFKKFESAEIFCQAFDERREFFRFRLKEDQEGAKGGRSLPEDG